MPEPESPSAVPYQAYRSKRQTHSRNVSLSRLTPSVTPPPTVGPAIQLAFDSYEKAAGEDTFDVAHTSPPTVPVVLVEPSPPTTNGLPSPPESPSSLDSPDTPTRPNEVDTVEDAPPTAPSSPSTSSAGSPSNSNKPLPRLNGGARKTSTFRHVPRARPNINSSPLAPPSHSRTASASSVGSSNLRVDSPIPSLLSVPDPARSRVTSPSPLSKPLPPSPALASPQPHHHASQPVSPPTRTSSLHPSPAVSPSSTAPPLPRPSSIATPPPPRPSAPYRPGFQPKGMYRPRTDEFLSLRKQARDGANSSVRIERTKLQRRLEKLINLHFPVGGKSDATENTRPGGNRRNSSFFDVDLGDLKRMNVSDAGGLWKSLLSSGAGGGKNDMRASEQRITPWQDDASASKCPMCTASFHPLTNRKHHCRLCGQIICSLPIKHPQRPQPCSLLFVVDPKTRKIEEVGEGVDYGVKRRRTGSISAPPGKTAIQEELDESEKFLKGVRICRGCKPILMRQQYQQEMSVVPTFSHLYAVLIELEKELEDTLPEFQELILSLTEGDQPTREAASARKRLLEMFSQYDAIAKRIRALPCKSGGSQDRVQLAVATRANVFLQKHMFPLQSLPKPKTKHKKSASKSSVDVGGPATIDPDSQMAHALQPLLEQEALLESFVEEAKAQRKFEDAKTLRINLAEIRAEIERMVVNAEEGGAAAGREKSKGKGKR